MPTPGRLFPGDFGASLLEMQLSGAAYNAYTPITRACCNYGCAKYLPVNIHAAAYLGKQDPTVAEVASWLKEYEKAHLVLRYKGDDGFEYLFFTRWFRDNYFKIRTKPSAPRPPCFEKIVSEEAWRDGDARAFARLFNKKSKKVSETHGRLLREGEGEGEEEGDLNTAVREVFDYYREKIQPKCRDLPKHLAKIRARLKRFKVEDLKKAVDSRAADDWFMKESENPGRGAAWFFSDDTKVERYINTKPRKSKLATGFDIAEEE